MSPAPSSAGRSDASRRSPRKVSWRARRSSTWSTAPPTSPTRWRASPTSTTPPSSRAATGAERPVKVVARRKVTEGNRSGGFAHEIDMEGGHTIGVDEPHDSGGTDTGPSPGRLLAASLASCTAVTMEIYAERKGWDVGAVEVGVDATYEGHVPTAFD